MATLERHRDGGIDLAQSALEPENGSAIRPIAGCRRFLANRGETPMSAMRFTWTERVNVASLINNFEKR